MAFEHSHEPDAISRRLAAGPRISYLRDWVYGAIDGAITTFAIVAGATGGRLSAEVVLILGLANVVADGFSMAAGNYTSTKAEIESFARLRAIEERHLALDPTGEREEIRQIYLSKGLRGSELDQMTKLITSHPRLWLETMMHEEYGASLAERSPFVAGLSTFVAFLAAGLLPLLPFVLGLDDAALVATVGTGLVFFLIGSVRSRWSPRGWFSSGVETLAIGTAAAGIALLIGAALRGLTTAAAGL
jgi:vacuolar iron transporter family protein